MATGTLQSKLLEGIYGLYETGNFADVLVLCGDSEWKAHRTILSAQSEYFMILCRDTFKGAKEFKIELKDDNPQVVHAMIQFCYQQRYDRAELESETDGVHPGLFHVRVYNGAHKFGINDLLDLTAKKFKPVVEQQWGQVEFAKVVPSIFQEALKTSPFKDCVTQVLKKYAVRILTEDGTLHELKRAIAAVPELSFAIACSLAGRVADDIWEDSKTYKCASCGAVFMVDLDYLEHVPQIGCPGCRRTKGKPEWPCIDKRPGRKQQVTTA